MTFLKLCAFGAFVLLLARMGGWRAPLPRVIIETLSFRKPAGQSTYDSESDSADSPPEEGSRSIAGGVAHVSRAEGWEPAADGQLTPSLSERWTSWLERWSTGAPALVHEAIEPGPTDRELERDALIEHLTRERARIGLSAVSIVRAASGQDDVPWGRVSESTVWRVWRELP
jgi:hypothetical protein